MAADFATFKALYPELVSAGDANQTAIEACIAEAEAILGTPPCPKLADNIILTFAAHCLAKSGNNPDGEPNTASGLIQSQSVGSVSVSYQVAQSQGNTQMADWFKSTVYGQKYLVLQKYCYGTGVMVAP